jgi:hypothetical protein
MSQVTISDKQDTLEVHHYDDQCSLSTPSEIKEKRGVVVDIHTGKVVCRSFPFTPEILASDSANLQEWISPLVQQKIPAYKSWEGTLLRVWCYNGRWMISTHRKLNAFKSRWGSEKSYGDLFNAALNRNWENFTDGLKQNRVYIFLLRSGIANRVVCTAFKDPALFVIGGFQREDDDSWTYFAGKDCDETGIPAPESVDYEKLEDLVNYTNSCDPAESQGVVMIGGNGESVGKIVNDKYDVLAKLRDNVPGVMLRYAQVRRDDVLCQRFRELYADFLGDFDKFEETFASITSNIYKKYVTRYIHKRVAFAPPEQFEIMKALFEDWKTTKNRISEDSVREYVGNLPAGPIINLYKRYNSRKEKFGDGNFVPEELKAKLSSI